MNNRTVFLCFQSNFTSLFVYAHDTKLSPHIEIICAWMQTWIVIKLLPNNVVSVFPMTLPSFALNCDNNMGQILEALLTSFGGFQTLIYVVQLKQ